MGKLTKCLIASALVCSTPVSSARTSPFSWGKPGLSIEQYRRDAVECGRAGYYLDVSNTEAAQVFKEGTSKLANNESDLQSLLRASSPVLALGIVTDSARIIEGTRPTERIAEVGKLMQGTVDDCLRGRGYVKFQLTAEQRKHLERLHLGSPERHDYLFRLSADPAILHAQAISR
jgi:hypothetical protein